MKRFAFRLQLTCLALLIGQTAAATAVAQTALLNNQTPWRVFLTCAEYPKHSTQAEGYTASPPADWQSADFDDSGWGRYSTDLYKAMGEYGSGQSHKRGAIYLRTRFAVEDPKQLNDLTLSLEYRGGVVVYVNGKEITRKDLPAGKLDHTTQADAYPKQAFVDPEGNQLRRTSRPAEEFLDRYEKRIRSLETKIPSDVLVKGSNVLAIELHYAPLKGMRTNSRDAWATVGICKVQLVSPSGRGAIAYDKLLDDIIVSNASVLDTIAVKPGKYRDEFLWWNMTVTPEGITMGNPLEPLRPIRTVGPKGGTCSGQVVASSLSGFSGLQAKISPMVHTDGQTALPEEALSVRYAHQADYESFCNALSTRPADGKPVQPVWVLADIPRDQKSGWYTGTLRLTQGKSAWQVPVQILVSPWQVPDHKDNATLVSMYQSPETLADTYKVQPFSDEHFKLIEKSFQAMAKSGNDVLLVPVIVDTYLHHKNGLIRWVEKDGQLQPEYDAFKRYLDLHTKYFGKPKVVTLLVWKHDFGCRTWFRGQNNDDIKPIMVTKLDARTGKMTPVEAPLFGKPGSEAFWKSMIQGVRNILAERKIDDRYLLLGEVFDSRPLPYTVEFFKKIAPEMRWQGYAHWVREPKPVNGKFIAHGGVEVGFKIGPNGGGLPEFHKNWPEVGKQEYLIAQAERTTIHYDSSPLTYRSVMYGDRDGGGTIARIGLDFWPSMHDHRGRFRSRYQSPPKEGWLWRGHCPSLTSPGPDGAVITTRGQMFLEGLQETELAIQLMRAKVKASQQMTQRIEQAIARRHESWRVGAAMPQATISLDWLGLAAEEYVLAAQLAGNQAENLWNNPPAVKDE